MENEETNGLTVGEIFHMIVKRIWYVLGATVAAALIAVLIVYFAVNPAQRSYSMQFTLVFPTGSNTSYPDGEPFFYRDMISAAALEEVKKTEGLSDVNTAAMLRGDDVEISAETVSENGVAVYTGRYTVRAKSSYFHGTEQAEAFIRAIADTTVEKMRTEAGTVNYAIAEEVFGNAPFEERLNLLAQERETILKKYDEWIVIYDAAYQLKVGETEKSLKDYRASVSALFGESVQKELEEELANGGYYYTDSFEAYVAKLKEEYAINKTAIEDFKSVGEAQTAPVALLSYTGGTQKVAVDESFMPTVSQRLVELIERNNKILHWLGSAALGESGSIEGTLTEQTNAAFAARIEAERAKLEQAAKLLTKVTQAIYNRGMQARFDMQKVKTEGGISILLAGIAAAVVAFVVACIVVCAVETSRRKKTLAAAAEAPEGNSPEEHKE